MINVIWASMLVIGFLYGAVNGTLDDVNKALFNGAKEGVTISIGLVSVLVFWLGMMQIATRAGLLERLKAIGKPLIVRLFPDIPPDHPAVGYILSNMIANLFGLGNAATPMGIKAMKQLKVLNHNKDKVSRSMITLLALNTSGLTLVPTLVIGIRMEYGSTSPTDIVGAAMLTTFITTVAAIVIDRLFYYRRLKKGEDA